MPKIKINPCMLLFILSPFAVLSSYSQNSLSLREFVFPKGIVRSEFTYLNSDGRASESSRMIYEYLLDDKSGIAFITNKENGTILSRRKEEYIITDSTICLFNINTNDILSYKRENFLGYTNCYLKMPKSGKEITYTYKESATTSYSCKVKITKRMLSDSVYTVLEVEKTPLENGQYMTSFKTVLLYVQGKGLYEEYMYSNKKTLYKLKSISRKSN